MSATTLALPPDLRVLVGHLAGLPPAQLLPLLPSLTGHVLRCGAILSLPADQKKGGPAGGTAGSTAAEALALAQRLRAAIAGLLAGRSAEGRLAGAALARAVVDVGGLEALRGADGWVRGLLAGLQRNDPFLVKELCVLTLARIYVLAHAYPTLVRELANPTLPAFIAALLALLSLGSPPSASAPAATNPKPSPQPVPPPLLVAAAEAASALLPLYPAAFRPYAGQLRAALRPHLAPTTASSAGAVPPPPVPEAVRRASRRTAVLLAHHAAPRAAAAAASPGGADEWATLARAILKECHRTADQVFRAVEEAWLSSHGHVRTRVSLDGPPRGGGDGADELLPLWEGILAGTERLTGLLAFLSSALRQPTRSAVAIPVGAIVDLITRISLVARLNPRGQTWEQALATNPAAQREERYQLWSSMAGIHIAVIELMIVLVRRLRANAVPVAGELVESLMRMLVSAVDVANIREAAYVLMSDLLQICGMALSKTEVGALNPLIAACCRDLQQSSGFLQAAPAPAPTSADAKKPALAHADLFLASATPAAAGSAAASSSLSDLSARHRAAAEALLVSLLSRLPQRHVRPPVRALLDQTAVVARSRDALLASALCPFRDGSGRTYASVMPFLAGMYPADPAVEALRISLRAGSAAARDGWAEFESVEPIEEADPAEDDADMDEAEDEAESKPEVQDAAALAPGTLGVVVVEKSSERRIETFVGPLDPVAGGIANGFGSRLLKRPLEDAAAAESPRPKRQEPSRPQPPAQPSPGPATRDAMADLHSAGRDEDSSDEESVHLNMVFDDEEESDDGHAEKQPGHAGDL